MTTPEAPLQYSDREWGASAYQNLLAMTVRYPHSHRDTIVSVLDQIHPGASPQEWLARSVSLSDTELSTLGTRMRNELVISRLNYTPDQLVTLAQQEPARARLAHWMDRGNFEQRAALTDFIESVDLQLMTDGQELAVGWEQPSHEDGEGPDSTPPAKRGWVLRPKQLSEADAVRLTKRLQELQGLVPAVRLLRDGTDALFASEYIEGSYATADDIVLFRKNLLERGIDESDFDLNQQNVVRTPDGRLLYVDGDIFD